jgi:uncharacterized membrane protein (DUF2068 family)
MKTNLGTNGPVLKHPVQSPETALDTRLLIEIFLATLTGVLSHVAAVLTTVVEPAGLWQYVAWGSVSSTSWLPAYLSFWPAAISGDIFECLQSCGLAETTSKRRFLVRRRPFSGCIH